MLSEIEYKKLLWHSRRGMWELDILLVPFAQQVLPTLPENEQLIYARLLKEEDQDLFASLVERVQHPDPELRAMITRIREFSESSGLHPH